MTPIYFDRQVLGWAFYDFANSAYATIVLSVVFNVYFVTVVAAGGVRVGDTLITPESAWSFLNALAMFSMAFIGPFLGARSDLGGNKKHYLACFWILGVTFNALLFFADSGRVLSSGIFFAVSLIGFAGSNHFYNALVGDLASNEELGRVSGWGWALGYLGGGLALLLGLLILRWPAAGFSPHLPVRLVILLSGVWWFVFGLPLFFFVKEKPHAVVSAGSFRESWREVLSTIQSLPRQKNLLQFFIAYLLYNDGIETVILMASIFGAKVLGMGTSELAMCFLMIQFVAFIGALYFGRAADRWGHRQAVIVTLWVFLAVTTWAAFLTSKTQFWILGAVVALVLGGSQAASRSYLAWLTPREKSGEYFGLFAVTGKLSATLGPLAFGLLSQFFSLRVAVAGLGVFFLVGLVILYNITDDKTL